MKKQNAADWFARQAAVSNTVTWTISSASNCFFFFFFHNRVQSNAFFRFTLELSVWWVQKKKKLCNNSQNVLKSNFEWECKCSATACSAVAVWVNTCPLRGRGDYTTDRVLRFSLFLRHRCRHRRFRDWLNNLLVQSSSKNSCCAVAAVVRRRTGWSSTQVRLNRSRLSKSLETEEEITTVKYRILKLVCLFRELGQPNFRKRLVWLPRIAKQCNCPQGRSYRA